MASLKQAFLEGVDLTFPTLEASMKIIDQVVKHIHSAALDLRQYKLIFLSLYNKQQSQA